MGRWSAVFKDQGISGAKGRDKRPGLDKLLQAVARASSIWSPHGGSIGWADR